MQIEQSLENIVQKYAQRFDAIDFKYTVVNEENFVYLESRKYDTSTSVTYVSESQFEKALLGFLEFVEENIKYYEELTLQKTLIRDAYNVFVYTFQQLGWKVFDEYAKARQECYDFTFVQRLVSPKLYKELDAVEVVGGFANYCESLCQIYDQYPDEWIDIDTYLG
jgi:hypothetical protein